MRTTCKYRLAACFLALLAPFAVRAGLTHTGTINSSGRKHLSNGYVYTVANDVTIKAGAGLSGIYLDANSTAVLYIPSGVTLKVQGGAGQGTSGGGAGIEVPSTSSLVVTGGGRLEATGGDGGSGGNGGDGDNAKVEKKTSKQGASGAGGAGGGTSIRAASATQDTPATAASSTGMVRFMALLYLFGRPMARPC